MRRPTEKRFKDKGLPVHICLAGVWKHSLKVLRIFLILWISVVVVLGFIQRKLIYHPVPAVSLPVMHYSLVMELFPHATDITVGSAGGQTIHGWYLCQQRETACDRPLVLLFHGNAGNRAGRTGWYELLFKAGCDVLAIDYQGYGDSTGIPSQAAIEADSLAAWDYAVQQLNCSPDNIFVMGISLGGAAAVHTASVQCRATTAPAGLITVATFSSMADVAAWSYPWLPVRAILLDRYPSTDRIIEVTCPFIQLHGDTDQIVNHSFGRRLFEAAPDVANNGIAKRWVTLANIGHNNIVGAAGPKILEELNVFLRSVAAAAEDR